MRLTCRRESTAAGSPLGIVQAFGFAEMDAAMKYEAAPGAMAALVA
jgi:hypothetical protein